MSLRARLSAVTPLTLAAAEVDLSSSSETLNSTEDYEAFDRLTQSVLFLTMLIFLGGTFFMTYRQRIPLPYTVVLFLYGIVVGAVALWVYPDVAKTLGSIPPNLLFYIFLPVLIFEGSYAINIHALRRVFPQTLLLATVGLLINTALLAGPVKLMFSSWSWFSAFLLGSLLSATDPVAVVALLKGLQVEKCITAMVDGEAVMNDGTAIIMFTLLLPAARTGALADSAGSIFLHSMRLSLLPVFLGPIFGFVQSFWIRRAVDGLTKACITVSVTYVSYYIASYLIGTSGVLTLFFQGVFLSYYCPSLFPGKEGNAISATWEFLVHLGNTVLFSLVGVILVADVVPTMNLMDIAIILALYAVIMVSRLVMLEILLPVLNLFSYKMNQRTVALMAHSGLRGGVSATLALAVRQEGLKEGVDILKMTSGIVLLTLLVNASTSQYVVSKLGFKKKEEYRLAQMRYAMNSLHGTEERALDVVKRDTKYRNASWMPVEKFVRRQLKNPYEGMTSTQEGEEGEEETRMINRLLMSAFKTALWRQRDEEVITETVVIELGHVLAKLIQRGELLDVQLMQLYHRQRGDSGIPRRSVARHYLYDGSVVDQGMRRDDCKSTVQHTAECSASATPAETRLHTREEQEELCIQGSQCGSAEKVSVTEEAKSFSVWNLSPETMGDYNLPIAVPLDIDVVSPITGDDVNQASLTNAMVESLMCRLLPLWARIAEKCKLDFSFIAAARRRAQENAFVTLLAVVKCLTALSPMKFIYVSSEAQAQRVERWLSEQFIAANRAIRFFYANFPEATNNVASSRAVISVANALHAMVHKLHFNHGFGLKTIEVLDNMVLHLRSRVPHVWENDVSQKQSNLVLRAVTATTLGRGLRGLEVKAISSMGLVRHFREGDVIRLPENAFLIVVFGSLRSVHGPWVTLNEHELMESFGDTVGLEALILPPEFCVDKQRRWRVISTEATALLISFNSVKPFLMERSLRAVKALWRAAAVETLLPYLARMVTMTVSEECDTRTRLIELIMDGNPLIGPKECELVECNTSFQLYFYLRGSDVSGLFNAHTPPCYISTFFIHQLKWTDPNVVLYAVPMRIGVRGYMPWSTINDSTSKEPMGVGEGHLGSAPDSELPDLHKAPTSHMSGDRSFSRQEEEEEVTVEMLPSTKFGEAGGFGDSRTRHGTVSPSRGSSIGSSHTASAVSSEHPRLSPTNHFGHPTVSTHIGATNIINVVLMGEIPMDPDLLEATASCSNFGDASDTLHTPLVPHSVTPSQSFTRRVDMRDDISIFYTVEEFTSKVPFVNQMFMHYAAWLEHLCIASLRYLKYPDDPTNVRHARSTGEWTLEYLLNFCVELSLLKRACRVISLRHGLDSEMSHPFHEGNGWDSAFQAKVCAWSRQSRLNGKFDLKFIITEMNHFANHRFPAFIAILKQLLEVEPDLRCAETAEGINKLCSRVIDGVEVEI